MGDIELLPCPHCGEPPQFTEHNAWCAHCEGYKSHELWNTRHGPALVARQEGEDAERWRFFAAHFDKPMMREWLRRGFGLHPDAFTPSITAVVDAARSGGGG